MMLNLILFQSCLSQYSQINCRPPKQLKQCYDTQSAGSYSCLRNGKIQIYEQSTGGRTSKEIEPIPMCGDQEKCLDFKMER